ncbi:hypothetical protein Rhe02_41560 [Rhizocola hellebori]|uniref:Uncharacterized protein n=1 Tax=Rhizocola hellebori TaxID=1392758 RepID=A0A8J3Q8P1_9ACTN|nr:hypothetical protein [Rhizocola hellebori]GIH06089.1 hypothetical protein Rhe02_41560 [Rhizocola hellebori]
MTAQLVQKRQGSFVFGAAALRTGWTWRRAQIRVGERIWAVEPTGRHRIGVTAHAGNSPAVRLHPQQSHVPGPGGPVSWRCWHRGAELTRDDGRIRLEISAFARGPVRVDVTGDWPDLDLVVLTAVFALMTRRRHRTLIIAAIAAATR